jgi:hypothetical protein
MKPIWAGGDRGFVLKALRTVLAMSVSYRKDEAGLKRAWNRVLERLFAQGDPRFVGDK